MSLNKARVIGANGAFRNPPASIVAARQFAIIDVSPDTDYRLRINDTVTTSSITISWAGTGPIFSEEIPFMIVGEVPDALSIPDARPRKRPRRPSRPSRRRKAARRKRKGPQKEDPAKVARRGAGTMRATRSAWVPLFALALLFSLAGCTRSLEMAYTPSLYRLPQADQWKGKPLGVAKLEDRRSMIDRTEPQSLGYVMQQGAWRFGLTYQGREYVPVSDLVQALFVDEFVRAGLETKAIPQVLTKDSVPAMRAAGEQAGVAYVLGGRILVFEIVNEDKFWTVVSRRSITLEITVVQVASGESLLDTTSAQTDRRDEGMGIRHSTNVDRLMNTVFRQVVTQVVEQVAAKLALDPRDVNVRVSLLTE